MSVEDRGYSLHELRLHYPDSGLHFAAMDSWSDIKIWSDWIKQDLDRPFPGIVRPPKHYEENVRTAEKEETRPGFVEAILKQSNSVAVTALDALADEVNAELPGILERKDHQTALSFYERAADIVRAGKPLPKK